MHLPFEWNYFALLTGKIVLLNKKKRNLRKYSAVFFLKNFPKKKRYLADPVCKIVGPVRIGHDFHKLYGFLNDIDAVQRINIHRLRWRGHVVRMKENAPTRRAFDVGIYGSRRRGRSCIQWKDQIDMSFDWCNELAWAHKKQKRLETGRMVVWYVIQ